MCQQASISFSLVSMHNLQTVSTKTMQGTVGTSVSKLHQWVWCIWQTCIRSP